MTQRSTRRAFLAGALVGSAAALAACSSLAPPAAPSQTGAPPRSMTFMAGYKPQANVSFVGVYVAQEMGYFKQQGLDVTIKHSSGQGEEVKLLAGKQIQVTTELATDLIKHVVDEGVPFISLAVLTQNSDSAMAALKSSGIDQPKQFEGKTVGYKVVPTFEYVAMLKSAGVDRSKIHEVSVGFDVRVLTEKKVDVLPVFKSNEPDLLKRLGFEVNLIDPSQYGVDSMGQIWVTHRELVTADPSLYKRFVKSSLNGLYYAFSHPKEAIDIVMKYAPQEDRSHQEFMLEVEKGNTLTEETRTNGLGWQSVERWSKLQDGLAAFGLIKKEVDPATLFAGQIQQDIYRNGQLMWP